MADRADITPEFLRQLFDYDPKTGKLFWRERTEEFFSRMGHTDPSRAALQWKVKNAGKEAGSLNSSGYKKVGILNTSRLSHRVAWAMHYGEWPNHHIDHINGIRTDNRISNLRDVPRITNARNRCVPSNNTSGCVGVIWHKAAKKWCAQIKSSEHHRHLGLFGSFQEAKDARLQAERDLGYHSNHGRMKTVSQPH